MSATQTKPNRKQKFIDFQALKQEIKIETAMPLLGLKPSQLSDQMRSACPACKAGGDRALVITASKNVFYCFASGEGGDVIALTAHIKGIGMKEAAAFLAEHFHQEPPPKQISPVATVPSHSSPKKNEAGQPKQLNPLTYLQPEHPLVQALGISPETCRHFGAGYAPKGIMRGRLAIPITDLSGSLVAYCGASLNRDDGTLLFPKGFDREKVLFNANSLEEGVVYLCEGPIDVVRKTELNRPNCVCFLTPVVSSFQLRLLEVVMEKRGCQRVAIY